MQFLQNLWDTMFMDHKLMYHAHTQVAKNKHNLTKLSNNPRTLISKHVKVNHLEIGPEETSDQEPDETP